MVKRWSCFRVVSLDGFFCSRGEVAAFGGEVPEATRKWRTEAFHDVSLSQTQSADIITTTTTTLSAVETYTEQCCSHLLPSARFLPNNSKHEGLQWRTLGYTRDTISLRSFRWPNRCLFEGQQWRRMIRKRKGIMFLVDIFYWMFH